MSSRETSDGDRPDPPPSQGVYGIGVAADLVDTAIQNLRAYERAGLLNPSRTPGGTRLYSPDDIARIRRVQALLSQGLTLAGIAQVMELQDDNQRLRDRLADLTGPADPDGFSTPSSEVS
jgi:MerR family transcriptional regulator/heat shock protein HspR